MAPYLLPRMKEPLSSILRTSRVLYNSHIWRMTLFDYNGAWIAATIVSRRGVLPKCICSATTNKITSPYHSLHHTIGVRTQTSEPITIRIQALRIAILLRHALCVIRTRTFYTDLYINCLSTFMFGGKGCRASTSM